MAIVDWQDSSVKSTDYPTESEADSGDVILMNRRVENYGFNPGFVVEQFDNRRSCVQQLAKTYRDAGVISLLELYRIGSNADHPADLEEQFSNYRSM